MYDKLATNPFTNQKRIIVVWVEEADAKQENTNYKNEL